MKEKIQKYTKLIGKEIENQITITSNKTFGALTTAEELIESRGWSHGRCELDKPIPFIKEKEIYIAKWTNIEPHEYNRIDGILLSNDFREGSVTIIEYK